MAGPRELVKISVPPAVPDWFQAVKADLEKTLQRMQQQIDAIQNGDVQSSASLQVTSVDASQGYQVRGAQVVGAPGAAVGDASGGGVIDVQARAALNQLLSRLRAHGLITP
jgi:hypothetical protein